MDACFLGGDGLLLHVVGCCLLVLFLLEAAASVCAEGKVLLGVLAS